MLSDQAAQRLVEVAANTIKLAPDSFHEVLDEMPAPIYATRTDGTITYFNPACVELAGRTPRLGKDKWCVTWRIYTTDGEYLPHEACPMAVAIREQREVRGASALAERPDGTRRKFVPYPTPLFADDGTFTGAVNLLSDVTEDLLANHSADFRATEEATLRTADIEALARIAARMAGEDPDDHATIRYGDFIAFNDAMWRYPDFMIRAEAAYQVLSAVELPDS